MSAKSLTAEGRREEVQQLRDRIAQLESQLEDRERHEQEVRESEQRWQSMFESAVDPIWVWDVANDRTNFSPSWPKLLGYDPAQFDPNEITWDSLLHPDDRNRVWDALNRCLRGETPEYEAEYRIRDRRGKWRWIMDRGVVAARDPKGNPLRMIGCVVDVTERRHLEQVLRDRLATESLLAAISSRFVNITSDEIDTSINDSLRRIGQFTGADRAYVFLISEDGERFSNTHEWCAPGIRSEQATLQDLEVDQFEWWMHRLRQQRAIHIRDVSAMGERLSSLRQVLEAQSIRSLIVMPMSYAGRLRGFLGFDTVRMEEEGGRGGWTEEEASLLSAIGSVFINAIEQRNAEQAIRENERFLSTLLSNLPGWVYRCRNDRDWKYEFGSDGMRDVLGYPPEAFMDGGELCYNDLIHPDDRELVWQHVQEAIADDEPFQLVYRVRTAHDTEKWLWEQGRAIKDEEGRIICLEGFVSDITEQKRAEDELRRQERDFHVIVKNTPDIILRWTRHLRLVYVNPVVKSVTGHSPEALLNRHVDEMPWPAPQRGMLSQAIRSVIQHKREYVAEFEIAGSSGRLFLESRFVPEFDDDGEVESVLEISRNVTMRKRAELGLMRANETQRLLLRELDHRVRNNLASLAALIDITSRNATSIPEFAESIRGRVQAMTAVHGLLSKGHWSSVYLNELLRSLIPADLLSRFDLSGPEALVGANQCTALGMVVQELVANSLKYGALHSPEGSVAVHWNSHQEEDQSVITLNMSWQERGGPSVADVNKPGLGTSLILGLVRTELRGSASLRYPPDGATHEFRFELEQDQPDD
jgi:PAS domain S-box-containing protein